MTPAYHEIAIIPSYMCSHAPTHERPILSSDQNLSNRPFLRIPTTKLSKTLAADTVATRPSPFCLRLFVTTLKMSSEKEISNEQSNQEIIDFGIYYLDMVQCPLNPNHKLRRHRLPYHLLKCKKMFPNKIQCPYGHYYYLEKHEMANHLQTCPYKPRSVQAEEMQPYVVQAQRARNENIVYNYDVDNFEIDEPYWD
ncbi:Uncharacterized protein FWK35_00017086 [Aphis craccivora]|uniref:CHHC U11-48K-type domain-containing protein n=1 Tax=Aphis craccivora TaxID=307492 RepID=A0A6G0Y4T3_APHCR|nr:Uncharacterized protein FWK35_00017086 [Aphis craccivora]